MKTFRILAIAAAGVMMMSCAQNECKFNAKEYAERKTEKLDEIVSLDDAQEKAVYAVYLKQGKQIQKEI
ncbi:MAG: hydrogenase iron-sulfur subunit, partial [Tidjanibacter sp.]|nr:hydrogenase iron-sulfur subunit [Tidjanibacter sp.]